MEKGFNYFLWIVVFGMLIGISIAMSVSKPSKTIFDESKLKDAIRYLNSDLPRNVGTIGTMDSIVYNERTITYNITVFGDNGIQEVYKENYNDFKDILKYSVLAMNGQRDMGNKFASLFDTEELNIGFRIYTQDGEATEWKVPGKELDEFMKACQMSPTTALRKTIDLQIEIANLNLPVKIEDVRDPVRSVALNTFLGEVDEDCLPKAISHVGEDIIFEYDVDEEAMDFDAVDKNKNNPDAIEILVQSLVEDEDAHEFLGMLAISHSNMVVTYEGRNTHRKVSIRIPYSILKKYCKVPQFLLS